jgi:hypothetical protein
MENALNGGKCMKGKYVGEAERLGIVQEMLEEGKTRNTVAVKEIIN